MRIRSVIVALAAAGFGLVALTPVGAQTAAAGVPVKDKKICRRIEVTGSFIGSRAVCRSKAEWASIDDANAKAGEDSLQRQRDTRPNRVEN